MKIIIIILLCFLIIFQALMLLDINFDFNHQTPIKVGVVYSTTGFRANKELPVQDSTLMAIEQINREGGIKGRLLIPVVRDGQSNWESTLKAIEDLIKNEDVSVIFGCWMLGNRIEIKDLLEKHDRLLISPFQYESIIESNHMVFVGITPNQQIPPTINYCFENIGSDFFLIGTDYTFAHVANIMVNDHVLARQGRILGEEYLPFEATPDEFEQVVQKIIQAKPKAIINTVFGQDNQLLFKKLSEAGVNAQNIPVFSFNITEVVLSEVDNIQDFVGHYATWAYFQSIDTPTNHTFIKNFTDFSEFSAIDNAVESGYLAPLLWAKAARETPLLFSPRNLLSVLQSMRINAPEGPVIMNLSGQYAWKTIRIGRIRLNGQFDIIWQSKSPIMPLANQPYRSKSDWQRRINLILKKNESPFTKANSKTLIREKSE